MTGWAIPWLCASLLATIPPLTEQQRQLLSTAGDRDAAADAPALVALLENAWTWPKGEQAGATVPDYAAILKDPAGARGQLFLVEGTIGRVRPIGRLARPGPWEDRLSEWTIKWGDRPDEVAVVDLVDPPEVKAGAAVRLAGRFYKVWRVQDAQGQATDFPLFVGRDARVVAPGPADLGLLRVALLLAIGAAGGAAMVRLLRLTARFSTKPPAPRTHVVEYEEMQELDDKDLPSDPAEALKELQRRREAPPKRT